MYYNYIHHILQVYTPWNPYLLNFRSIPGFYRHVFLGSNVSFVLGADPTETLQPKMEQIGVMIGYPSLALNINYICRCTKNCHSILPILSEAAKQWNHTDMSMRGLQLYTAVIPQKNTVNKQLCQMVVSAHSSTTVDNIHIRQDRMVCA